VALAAGVAGLQPLVAGPAAAASGLNAPTGLAPNSATSPQQKPVLSWSEVAGATSYQVELSKSSDWSDQSNLVSLPDNGDAPTSSYAVPQTLVHGIYYWRVRAEGTSTASSWSANAQLDRAWSDAPSTTGSNPTLDATATQSGIATYPWRFAWTPIPDASTYEIELSVYPTFTQPGNTQSGNVNDGENTVECLTDSTSWTPYSNTSSNLGDVGVDTCDLQNFDTAGTTVYWRVRGIDDSDTAQVAAASQHNSLECFGVPNTTPGPGNAGLASATALGSPTSAGQECSNWSATKSVGYPTDSDYGDGAGPVPAVSGVSLNCATGSTAAYNCSTMPEISWQPAAHAQEYEVTIADDASMTNIEHQYETPFLSVTPRDDLADYTAGDGYYVAVQACVNGSCGTATETSFTKATPKVGTLTSARVHGGERLTWSDLAGQYATTPAGTPALEAENYKVQVTAADDTSFDNPVITSRVDGACDASLSATCYAPPGAATAGVDQTVVTLPNNGNYIWRVSPVDISGNVLPAAVDTSAFSNDVTPPAFTITSSDGVGVKGPLAIKASEPVTGVSAATVHVVPVGGHGSVAGTLTHGSVPDSWNFHPSSPLVTGETYTLNIDPSVQDQGGNSAVVRGSGVRTITKATDTSKAWTFNGKWTKHAASGARSGSYKSASAGHSAKLVVAGSAVKLFACKGPGMGEVSIKLAGHSQKVSLHQSYTRCGVKVWHKALQKGESTMTVKVSKRKGTVDEVAVT
jgi:hypothetical protein